MPAIKIDHWKIYNLRPRYTHVRLSAGIRLVIVQRLHPAGALNDGAGTKLPLPPL